MDKIHIEINEALANCHMKTGEKAKSIYLGRTQMDRLMQWAKENQYVSDTEKRDGKHRPEVLGCLVYEGNDDDHCIAV